jgi:hypothetical protein
MQNDTAQFTFAEDILVLKNLFLLVALLLILVFLPFFVALSRLLEMIERDPGWVRINSALPYRGISA